MVKVQDVWVNPGHHCVRVSFCLLFSLLCLSSCCLYSCVSLYNYLIKSYLIQVYLFRSMVKGQNVGVNPGHHWVRMSAFLLLFSLLCLSTWRLNSCVSLYNYLIKSYLIYLFRSKVKGQDVGVNPGHHCVRVSACLLLFSFLCLSTWRLNSVSASRWSSWIGFGLAQPVRSEREREKRRGDERE